MLSKYQTLIFNENAVLADIDKSNLSATLVAIDKFAGNLSYPLFLLHTTCGIIIYSLLGDNLPFRGYSFFCISLIFSNMLSIVIYLCYDNSIQNVRIRYKK